MSNINPNVAVGNEAGTMVVSGNQPLSFEDLARIPSKAPAKNADPERKGAEAKDQKTGADKKATDQKGIEKVTSKEDNKETKSHAYKDGKHKPDDFNPGAMPDPEKQEISFIKGKHGDQEIDLAHDTVIPTKVSGKLESPTLKELQQNYSGKVNWDKKYSELAKDKAGFQQQVQELNGYINRMVEATAKDPLSFYDVVAEILKVDPVEMKMNAIEQQLGMLQKLQASQGGDIEGWKKSLRLKFREDAISSKEQRATESQRLAEENTRKAQTMEKYGIEPDDFQAAENTARGIVKDRQVTTHDIVMVHRHNMVIDVLSETMPHLADNQGVDEIIKSLRDEAVKNPQYTKEDIADIVRQVFGGEDKSNKRAQSLSKKVLGNGRANTKQESKQGKVLYSFDQI